MLTVVTWKWGALFGPEYVNRLRAGLRRHLHVDHELVCVTDDPSGIDSDVRCVPITDHQDTPRCRRRLKQFDAAFAQSLGHRMLTIDLDVVIVGDITPLATRPEPIVCWKVGYAGVYSGSFLLYDAGALHGLWQAFNAAPDTFPQRCSREDTPSDQAMLNFWIGRQRLSVGQWTEADGLVTYFGYGYERFAHLGVGPSHPNLPAGARIVVLGSADKDVLDGGQFPWVQTNWSALEVVA